MKWSFKIARLFGIDVHLHFTFLLFFGFIALVHARGSGSWAGAIPGVALFVLVFLCVLAHEFGHALAARKVGVGTRHITLLPIGGVAQLERMPRRPMHEFWIAVAGPAVNVVIALGLAVALVASGSDRPFSSALAAAGDGILPRLLAINVFLVLFNLLPAFPMDGGRVLRSLLALRFPFDRATRIAARTGQGMAVLFGIVGLIGNPMLLIIAFFVWFGAAQEAAASRVQSSLSQVPVTSAMLTRFDVLHPDDMLGRAAGLVLSGSQADFPVVEDGRMVGVLSRSALLAGLRQQGENVPVRAHMNVQFMEVPPEMPADELLQKQETAMHPVIPVTHEGRLLGIVTLENLGEYAAIRAALQRRSCA